MSILQQLTSEIVAFRDERDWSQFHSPKNLAAALSIETAELQELFLWKTDDETSEYMAGEEGMSAISDELADVFTYALLLAHETGCDPVAAIRQKLRKNAARYPASLAKGKADKYTAYDKQSEN